MPEEDFDEVPGCDLSQTSNDAMIEEMFRRGLQVHLSRGREGEQGGRAVQRPDGGEAGAPGQACFYKQRFINSL